MLLLALQFKKGIITFYMVFVCSVWLCTFFDCYKPLSTTIYYFWQLYITFTIYILLLTAIYYFRHYILLLALSDCDFVRVQDFLAILHICRLKARLEFNSDLLAINQFCFFWSLIVSFINLNSHFENAVLLEILKC